ncbi:MAG: hypothetical protein ACRD0G_10685 [Acidimicrobiales bacterium]
MSETSERAAFLERSLADLEQEHDAGDLSDDDYTALRSQYERRRAGPPVPAPPARRRPGLVVAAVGFVVVVAVAAGVLVAQFAGRRGAGDTLTGGIATVPTTEARLASGVQECVTAERGGAAEAALNCYLDYTESNGDDAAGFAYFGWWLARRSFQSDQPELRSAAERSLARAVELDPELPDARVFRAVFFERTGRVGEARTELATLDALDPPQELLTLVEPLRERLAGG